MYLIKLKFESNIKGIYTYEEETADNEEMKNMKLERILKKWCINFRIISYNYCGEINIIDFIKEIKNYIDDLNMNIKEGEQKRRFVLEVIHTDELINV